MVSGTFALPLAPIRGPENVYPPGWTGGVAREGSGVSSALAGRLPDGLRLRRRPGDGHRSGPADPLVRVALKTWQLFETAPKFLFHP